MRRVIAIAALALAGCAQTNYQVYEGRGGPQVVEGQGGTKEIVDGYEVWDNGDPPRRYQVLGVATVEDFDNQFGQQRIRSAIAGQIKQAGGDAAVVIGGYSQGQTTGYAFNTKGQMIFGGGSGRKQVKYQIVRYTDKAPGETIPAQSSVVACPPGRYRGPSGTGCS